MCIYRYMLIVYASPRQEPMQLARRRCLARSLLAEAMPPGTPAALPRASAFDIPPPPAAACSQFRPSAAQHHQPSSQSSHALGRPLPPTNHRNEKKLIKRMKCELSDRVSLTDSSQPPAFASTIAESNAAKDSSNCPNARWQRPRRQPGTARRENIGQNSWVRCKRIHLRARGRNKRSSICPVTSNNGTSNNVRTRCERSHLLT